METIDFVITWVDGEDPKWLAEKQKYQNAGRPILLSGDANSDCRYRSDHELLRFWFRAVEKFAPWVRTIHFVTCGQKPYWLNENHSKLSLVNHKDFIPKKFLPTFNANPIEMNFHRIENLAEQFVFFNDDMFLLHPIGPDFFFRGGVPVLISDLRYPKNISYNNWSRLVFNDYCILQKSFNMKDTIWRNRKKWFDFSELGVKRTRQNFLSFLANKSIPVHIYGHLSSPHLKSSFQSVWDVWSEVMDITCSSRFRSDEQVNQWLLCGWNQALGKFYPAHEKNRGKNFSISPNNLEEVRNAILSQAYPQICINDTGNNTDPQRVSNELIEAFSQILPKKSEFELD